MAHASDNSALIVAQSRTFLVRCQDGDELWRWSTLAWTANAARARWVRWTKSTFAERISPTRSMMRRGTQAARWY